MQHDSPVIRLGWQTTWATQGQIVQTLARTDAFTKYGIDVDLIGATYGGPLNEAALSGSVDVIFTADQPAISLLSRDSDWTIVGRLMYNRVGVYVPPKSSVDDFTDLIGKTIAVPFGAAAQRFAINAVTSSGYVPGKDIDFVNLDITEQASVASSPDADSWGHIGAMAGFDPTFALLVESELARTLSVGTVIAVIVVHKRIATNPGVLHRFLAAVIEAQLFYSQNTTKANDWFLDASGLNMSHTILKTAAEIEPNLKVATIGEIRISLSDDDIASLEDTATFMFDHGLTNRLVDVRAFIDLSAAREAGKVVRMGGLRIIDP